MTYKRENSIGEDGVIALLREDNEKGLSVIFKKYHAGLLYFASQYLPYSQAAEDIVAESFIKIWQRRADFNSLPAIKSFLYITVKNACLNQLKQTNHHRHTTYVHVSVCVCV